MALLGRQHFHQHWGDQLPPSPSLSSPPPPPLTTRTHTHAHNTLNSHTQGLSLCTKLEELTIDRNLLHTLDPPLHHLPALQWLSASHNVLTTLPSTAFTTLTKLEYLNVSNNSLRSLEGMQVGMCILALEHSSSARYKDTLMLWGKATRCWELNPRSLPGLGHLCSITTRQLPALTILCCTGSTECFSPPYLSLPNNIKSVFLYVYSLYTSFSSPNQV